MHRFALATLAAASFAAALPAQAHEQVYAAPLLSSSEIPAAASSGHGSAMVTMDFDLVTMRVQITFADLVGTTTASHIHCCTVTPGSANVGVATLLPSFTAFPNGVKAGSYDHTFDMSQAANYNAGFISGHGGTVGSAFNALVAGLDSGNAYLNIHTSSFPGGEVRALLAPVPEPESYALMLGGLGALALVARRRKS